MEMTKQQIINKVEDLEEDNKALWHYVQHNEKEIKRLKEKIKFELTKLKEKT